MKKTINIDFNNSSSVILGYDPNILSLSSSGFAYSTHTHGNVSLNLSNLTGTYTSVSNGLTIALTAGTNGGNVVYAGNNITLSTTGVSTTVSVYGLASNNHAHGTSPAITGNIGGTISSDGWSISIPDFLVTAAQSDHTHSNLYFPLSNSTLFASSVLDNTFLTTAANVTHTHGSFLGTNITAVSSGSAGLALSVSPKLGTNTSSNTVSGTNFIMTGGTSGLTLSMPKFITTAADLSHTHGNISTVSTDGSVLLYSSSSNGLSLAIPAWITSGGGAGGNNLILEGNTLGTITEMSSGTVSIAGGNNITLSQDGNAFTIIGAASGTVPGIALALGSSGTWGVTDPVGAGTVYFEGQNVLVSKDGSTVVIIGQGGTAGTGFTSTTATALIGTLNGSGLLLGVPTYMASNAGSNFPGLGSSITGGEMTYNSNGLTISIDPADAYTAIFGIAGSGASTITDGTVQFANSNGISFGLTGSTVTASYATNDYIGTAYLGYYQATNDNSLSIAKSESNAFQLTANNSLSLDTNYTSHTHSNLYLNTSISSAYQTSVLSNTFAITSHTHSNLYGAVTHIHGINTLSFSNFYSSSTGSSSNNVVIGLTGYPATSFVNVSETGSVYFVNSNSISFGTAVSSNSTSITASFAGAGGAGTGITTASTSGSILAGTLNNSGLSLGIPTWITEGGTGGAGNLSITAGSFSNTLDAISFANSNGLAFGLNGSTFTGSYTVPSGYISFEDGSNVSWGTTIGSLSNLTVVTASLNPVGGGAGSGTTIGTTSGTDLVMTLNATGLNISHPNWLTTAADSAHTHDYQSTGAYLTTAMASDAGSLFQSTGAYLTTAAQSVHTHDYQSTGAYLTTAAVSNHTHSDLYINTSVSGSFLTTAALSNHTHSDLYQSTGAYLTTAMASNAGSNFVGLATTGVTGGSATINSSQLQLNIPQGSLYYEDGNGVSFSASSSGLSTTISAYVNTGYAGTGSTLTTTSGSVLGATFNTAGLNIEVPAWITTAGAIEVGSGFSTGSTASGTNIAGTLNSNGLSLIYPSFLTTGAVGGGEWTVATTGGTDLVVSTATNTNTVYYPKWITTAAQSGHTHSDLYINTSVSGSFLTTAAASNHTHSDLYQSTGAYLTTAAVSDHTHVGIKSFYLDGNSGTTGSSAITDGGFVLAGGSNITLSQSNGSISIIGATANGPASVVFSDGSGVSWGSTTSGSTTTIIASVKTDYIVIGNIVFGNSHGHSFCTSNTLATTHIWIQTA